MKLKVPFCKQSTSTDCGIASVKMVASYFKKNVDDDFLIKLSGKKEGKGLSTIQLTISLRELGFDVEFFSKHIGFNEDNLKLDFYKKYGAVDLRASEKSLKKAIEMGVNVEEKVISIEEFLSKVDRKCVAIVLLDWNIVLGKSEAGYQGRFVPVVGYDKNSIYVHNSNDENGYFFKIDKEIFDKARKANGTDEDVIFVSQ